MAIVSKGAVLRTLRLAASRAGAATIPNPRARDPSKRWSGSGYARS